MRSYAAGEREIFGACASRRRCPYLFTGLKVATVLAMIGAIVGDYFGGSQEALGIQIRQVGRDLRVRERPGRRSSSPACSESPSTGRSRSPSASTMSWHPSARGAGGMTRRTTKERERMRRARWLWLAAVAVLALVGAGCGGDDDGRPAATGHGGAAEGPGHRPAQVGDAGAVRRLLRGAGPGVLRRRGPRRRRSRSAGPTSSPSRSCSAARPSSGIDWLDNLLATRDQGGEIVNIAQVFARSGMTEVTWKDSGLDRSPSSRARRSASGSAGTSTSSSPR